MVRELVDAAHFRLSRLEDEITRITTVLVDMRRRREELQFFAKKHASLIAPVRKLPTELLYMVFRHYLVLPNVSRKNRLDRRSLILANVCRTWHNAALALPWIWSDIQIHLPPDNAIQDAKLMNIWFQRAGSHPLSITIAMRKRVVGTGPLTTMLSHYSQIQERTLQAAALETLISLEPIPGSLEYLGIPWKQLHILNLRGITRPEVVLSVLKQGVNPHTIELPYCGRDNGYRYQDSIILSKLLHLSLQVENGTPMIIFNALQLPILREVNFRIAHRSRTIWKTSEDLLSLLSRSPISRLTISTHGPDRANPSGRDLARLLQAVPGLKMLLIYGKDTRCMDDDLISQLAPNLNMPMIVPLLRQISIQFNPRGQDSDIAAFADAMVSRKCSKTDVLESVHIRCLAEDEERLKSSGTVVGDSLDRLRGVGVVVSFSSDSLYDT